MVSTAQGPNEWAGADLKLALDRIMASAAFRASPMLRAFLRFVVERALAGKSAQIKGYTVAVEALGRRPDFDPRIDPIVRVEAGRLRRLLARYYADEGAGDAVVFELRRGSYVPIVHRRAPPPAPAAEPRIEDAADLSGAMQRLIALYGLQLQAIAAEVEIAERIVERSRLLRRRPAAACRPRLRLVPTAPSPACDVARPADGRQAEQTQQAESPPAARARRPRPGRDRCDAAHAGKNPRRL